MIDKSKWEIFVLVIERWKATGHTVRTRVTKGATKADMQSFVRGETWDDLMTRIKPSVPPLILYTKMTEQKMLGFVISG